MCGCVWVEHLRLVSLATRLSHQHDTHRGLTLLTPHEAAHTGLYILGWSPPQSHITFSFLYGQTLFYLSPYHHFHLSLPLLYSFLLCLHPLSCSPNQGLTFADDADPHSFPTNVSIVTIYTRQWYYPLYSIGTPRLPLSSIFLRVSLSPGS